MSSPETPRKSASLEAQIAAAEQAVKARRELLAERTQALGQAVKFRLVVPGVLLATLGVGVRGWFGRKRNAAGVTGDAAAAALGGRAARAWRLAGRGLKMLAAAQVLQPLIRAALDGRVRAGTRRNTATVAKPAMRRKRASGAAADREPPVKG